MKPGAGLGHRQKLCTYQGVRLFIITFCNLFQTHTCHYQHCNCKQLSCSTLPCVPVQHSSVFYKSCSHQLQDSPHFHHPSITRGHNAQRPSVPHVGVTYTRISFVQFGNFISLVDNTQLLPCVFATTTHPPNTQWSTVFTAGFAVTAAFGSATIHLIHLAITLEFSITVLHLVEH